MKETDLALKTKKHGQLRVYQADSGEKFVKIDGIPVKVEGSEYENSFTKFIQESTYSKDVKSRLPEKINPKVMKKQNFKSKIGICYNEYCGRCGVQISPENFSNMRCPECDSGLRTHGIYAIAENGSEGKIRRLGEKEDK